MTIVDSCYRLAYKVAYPCLVIALKVFRLPVRGVFVYIWHDRRLLIVKNSYKRRYSLPGGLLKRGEDPLDGAIRETAEEVGIHLDRGALQLRDRVVDEHGARASVVEVHLRDEPAISIDQREIVWAGFLPLHEVGQLPLNHQVAAYLKRRQAEDQD